MGQGLFTPIGGVGKAEFHVNVGHTSFIQAKTALADSRIPVDGCQCNGAVDLVKTPFTVVALPYNPKWAG